MYTMYYSDTEASKRVYIFLTSSPLSIEVILQTKEGSVESIRERECMCLPVFPSRPQTHLLARLQLFSELSSWAEGEEDAAPHRP